MYFVSYNSEGCVFVGLCKGILLFFSQVILKREI